MLDILHFLFSSFWIWLGATIMLTVITAGVTQLLSAAITALVARGQ